LCDNNNPGDGFETFDLTTRYNEITNNQAGLTLTYQYNDGTGLVVIANPSAFTNTIANTQTITVTATNANGCSWNTTFQLIVNPLPVANPANPIFICSDGTSTTTGSFDLTIRNNEITGGVTGVTVSYHLTQADANNGVNALPIPYTNTINGQIVYARVQNTATGCFNTTTLQLNVVPGPVPGPVTPLQVCD
ncbi:MAG: hypothetical protein ACK4JX_11300, partial [Flavobacterium sp.]